MTNPPLVWHSNAPWAPTGYGNQTGVFVPLLKEHYNLAVSAFYGLQGARLTWDGVQILPGFGGDFGNEYLAEHARRHFGGDPKGGLTVTLMDVWVLDPPMASLLNMACWVPVDHQPAPPAVGNFFAQSGAVPIAMSRFGQQQLAAQGLQPLYVPHGVNVDKLKPYSREDVRKRAGVPQDAFLVGMVAANKGRPSRKGFQQAFQAFAAFRQKHPEALLYLHTIVGAAHANGEDLGAILGAVGVPPEAVLTADQYRMMLDPVSEATMAQVYSTMDVLINCAMGEGFGIPVLEAQACGIPAIVTNFSAMPEVCGAGWHVDCMPYWTPQNSWQAMPSIDDMVAALEACYDMPAADRATLSAKARQHALSYDSRKVLDEYMLPALDVAWKRLSDRPVELVASEAA